MSNNCIALQNSTECTVGKRNESMVPPILQFMGGFIGNALALFILFKSAKNHQWKPFNRLVCALALTDATVSCLVYPIVFKRYASHFTYCFSTYECHHVAFMYSFAFLGSALLVTAMSYDRFLAILFPFTYNASRKFIRTTIMIIGSWILAIIICALPLLGVGKVKLYYPESWCFIDFVSKDSGGEISTYMYAILGLVIFAMTVTFNLSVIITIIRKIRQSKKKLGVQKRLMSDIYNVVFLLGIVIVFSVCWVPLTTRMIYNINSACPSDGQAELLVARLAITNSIIDPWIYIVLRKENFEFLERIIQQCKKQSVRGDSTGNLTTISSTITLDRISSSNE